MGTLDHETRVREEAVANATAYVEKLQGGFEAAALQWDECAADFIEHARMNAESLANEVKERMADNGECMKLLCQAKDQIEKEMVDRKAMVKEILKQNSELGLELEHERSVRDREEGALRTSIATLKQEFSVDREQRVTDMASTKRNVQSLEVRMTEEFRDLRQCLDFEIGERSSTDMRVEKQCIDIKTTS